jgi:hypothetical protein
MSSMHMNNMSNSNNNTTRGVPHVPSVPDLLSFDSWDYDSTMVSATSSFTDPSYGENEPHHQHSSASISSSVEEVNIQVSGASFILNPTVFRQLEKLPWSVINFNDNNVVYSLGTSPDLFEIILNYVLFESLPDIKLLSQSDIEELEPMVYMTGLQGLQNHLEKKDLKNKILRSRSFRRNPSTAVPAHELQQQLERHISTNNMNNGNDKDDDNNNKLLRRQISAPILEASSTHETVDSNKSNTIKGMASRLAQAVARRRPIKQQQQQKLTHAECVASDLVD